VKQKSVLLVGEHNLLRAFLRAWLGRFDDLRVGAESSDASHAVDMVKRNKPALVLMDFDTLQVASLEVLAKIRSAYPLVKVIIYFAYANDQVAFKVMRAGAAGFVVKDAQSEDMENAIKTVLGGGVYLSSQFLKSLGSAEGVSDKDGKALSPRQGEILKLVALGMSTKDVAYELKISAKTVDVHKQALMSRLGVKSTTGLVKFAIRSGLVPA
jgi:DNA-binding NarL/FixJ family response regulator